MCLLHILYVLSHCLILEYFHHPRKKTCSCQWKVPLPTSPLTLATARLYSVSVDSPLSDISYQWLPTVCGLLWLVSSPRTVFSGVIRGEVYVRTLFLFRAEWCYAVERSHFSVHSLFISWWTFGWFLLCWTTRVQVFGRTWIFIFLRYIPRGEIATSLEFLQRQIL